MRAGFSEVDITPPVGTAKVGNLAHHVGTEVADPLKAKVFVAEDEEDRLALAALDTLSVGRKHVAEMRRRVEEELGFPGENVMIVATHTHGSPAVVRCGEVAADEAYVASVTDAVLGGFKEALGRMEEAEMGFGRAVDFGIAKNRRVVMRDGTVRTHGDFDDPEAAWIEGPVDPEIGVVGARATSGEWLGCLVNFACHPTDHGDDGVFTAGFPGVLASRLREEGVPACLFVNGALGNAHPMDPTRGGEMMGMEEVGEALAERVVGALAGMGFRADVPLGVRSEVVGLPFREAAPEEVSGTVRGAQRFATDELYGRTIAGVLREAESEGRQVAEVQALRLGSHAIVGVPAEPFAELGLEMKEDAYPLRVMVAGMANGIVGYVPHRAAFDRGGFETTFSDVSKLAPGAGELLAEAVARLLRS